MADLFVDLHQGRTQRLKLVELGHLARRLAQGGGAGKRFRDRLAFDLPGQAKIRSMARMSRPMASTVGFPTASRNARNRTPPKISQPGYILHHLNSLLLQLRKSFGHKPPFPNVYIR